jgi:hypothetical protein
MMSDKNDNWRLMPTRSAIPFAACTFVPALRTTLCDIQCTTNTPFPVDELPPPPDAIKQITATLPYDRPLAGLVGPMKCTTKFQKYKIDDSIVRKMAELKRDREVYFRKLQQEKAETMMRKNKAATKIQAAFRGYRSRPKKNRYIPKRKPNVFLSHFELYDELCKMASDLNLNPIPGLNLESRTKASKRKVRIENAAAFRLQKFFRMLYQKSMAKIVVIKRKQDKIHKAAKVVTKAIRYIITRKFVKRVDHMKRIQSSIKIQCKVRQYQARLR